MDQAPEYLNLDLFFQTNAKFNNEAYKKKFKQIVQNAKEQAMKLITASLKAASFQQALQILNSNSPDSGVCSAKISNSEICWTCQDCQQHPNSIICQKCFEMGNHKGHKVLLKRFCQGCCDCGDSSFWKQSGNCSLHNGANIDNLEKNQSIESLYNIFYILIEGSMKEIISLLNDPQLFPRFKSPEQFPYQLLNFTELLNFLEENNLFCCKIAIEILESECPEHHCNYLNAFLKNYYRLPQALKHVSNIFLYPLLRSVKFKKLYGEALIANFQNMIIYASNIDAFDNFGVQVAPIYQVSCDWGLKFLEKAVDTFAFAFQVLKQQSGKTQPQHLFHYWSMYMKFYLEHQQNRLLFAKSEEFPRFLLYCSYLDFFHLYKKQLGPFPLSFYEQTLNLGLLDAHHSLQKVIISCLVQLIGLDGFILPAFKKSYHSVIKLRRELQKLDATHQIVRSPNLFSLRMAGHVFTAATVMPLLLESLVNSEYSELSSQSTDFVLKCRDSFRKLETECLENETRLNFYPEVLISSRFTAEVESREWLNLGYNYQRIAKLYNQSLRGYDLPMYKQDQALFQLNILFNKPDQFAQSIIETIKQILDNEAVLSVSHDKKIEELEIILHRLINCFCNPKPVFMMLPSIYSMKPSTKLEKLLRDLIKAEIVHLLSITPNKALTFGEIVKLFDSSLSGLDFFENEIIKHLKVEQKRGQKFYSLKNSELVDPYYFHILKMTIDYQVSHPATKLGNLTSNGSHKRCGLWKIPFFRELRMLAHHFDKMFLESAMKLDCSQLYSEGIKISILKLFSLHLQTLEVQVDREEMELDLIFLESIFSEEETKEEEASLKETLLQLKQFLNSELNPTSEQHIESQSISQKQQNRDEMIKKKKQKALQKLKKKRAMFQLKNEEQLKEEFHHFQSQRSCILCHESLVQTTSHPYGVTGYIGMNRLYYHGYKKTLRCQNPSLFEELKQGEIEANLEHISAPRTYLQSCGHYIHLKCYNDYKMNGKLEGTHEKLLELDEFEFLCPLCKTLCNFIFPVTLNEEVLEKEVEDTLQFKFELPHTHNLFEYLDFEGLEVLVSQSQKCRRYHQGVYFKKSQGYLFKDFKDNPNLFLNCLVSLIQNSFQIERLNSPNYTASFLTKSES